MSTRFGTLVGRLRPPRPAAVLSVVAAAAVLVVGLGAASASQLDVAAGHVAAASAGHPCPGTASMVPANRQTGTTFRSVVLALPAGCGGLPVQLYLDGATDRSGSATTDASGVVSIRMSGNYDRSLTYTAHATVNGWNLPVAWNTTLMPAIWCTVVDTSGATCTATVAVARRANPESGALRDYYDVVVTTTSAAFVQWEVGFNLDHSTYGTRPTRLGNSNFDQFYDGQTTWSQTPNYVPATTAARFSACSELGVLRVRGTSSLGGLNNDFQYVRNDRERHFTYVVNLNTNGYYDVLSPNCA